MTGGRFMDQELGLAVGASLADSAPVPEAPTKWIDSGNTGYPYPCIGQSFYGDPSIDCMDVDCVASGGECKFDTSTINKDCRCAQKAQAVSSPSTPGRSNPSTGGKSDPPPEPPWCFPYDCHCNYEGPVPFHAEWVPRGQRPPAGPAPSASTMGWDKVICGRQQDELCRQGKNKGLICKCPRTVV